MRRHAFDILPAKERRPSFKDLLRPFIRWRASVRNRRILLSLDDRLLRDIGLTRHEIVKGFDGRPNGARTPL